MLTASIALLVSGLTSSDSVLSAGECPAQYRFAPVAASQVIPSTSEVKRRAQGLNDSYHTGLLAPRDSFARLPELFRYSTPMKCQRFQGRLWFIDL